MVDEGCVKRALSRVSIRSHTICERAFDECIPSFHANTLTQHTMTQQPICIENNNKQKMRIRRQSLTCKLFEIVKNGNSRKSSFCLQFILLTFQALLYYGRLKSSISSFQLTGIHHERLRGTGAGLNSKFLTGKISEKIFSENTSVGIFACLFEFYPVFFVTRRMEAFYTEKYSKPFRTYFFLPRHDCTIVF